MKTVSEKQLAANRANAAKSTGPRTPEGKARAASNSRKHGLVSSTCAASGIEETEELQNLVDDAVAFYQPQNSQEQFAVERIALCQFAILRAYRLEADILTNCFAAGCQTPDRLAFRGHSMPQRNNRPLATGFEEPAALKSFALLLRYQAQADRQYRRAVEDFQRLVRERIEDSPNEPISDSPSEAIDEPASITTAPQPPVPSPQSQDVLPVPSAHSAPEPTHHRRLGWGLLTDKLPPQDNRIKNS